MKKISFLTAVGLIFFTGSQLNAQVSTDKLNFGFKISPNFSWLKVTEGDVIKNDGLGLGFTYGLTADYKFTSSDNYYLAADLLISTAPAILKHEGKVQRTVADTTENYEGVGFDYRVQYLQIPISIKLKSNQVGKLKYYLNVGMAPSFAISKRLSTKVPAGNTDVYDGTNVSSHDPNATENTRYQFDGGKDENVQYIFEDDISVARMSLVFGAGVEYPMSGNALLVAGVRFDNGFTDFLSDNAYSGRHNFISLSAGIMF